jgi:serine/threonine protein kinase
MAAIWRGSKIIDYGSSASIRITEDDSFPIVKLAHPDELSIKLIQHEFNVLANLAKLGLPVVEFDQHPILDNGVTCGYRMKKLTKLELSEFRSRTDEIKHTLDRFHSAGFCHGDFTPSNIMKDESGRIILIDLSFAGQLGSAVPSFFPTWVHSDGMYGIDSDLKAFRRDTVPIQQLQFSAQNNAPPF